MSTVLAVTKATGEGFIALREEAQRLGATTRFAATEAAQAMVFLGRAGFSTTEVLKSTNQVLLLAQAGALDLASAADITAGALRGFRLEVDQAGRVTDVLAKAATSSATDVLQLGQALKFVAPVAAGLNISIEDTTAAISALSDAQLKGTLAGTGLRGVLAKLEAPSAKLRAVLFRAGKTIDDIRPSTVGLTEALRVLRAAGVGAGEGIELFGLRAGPAFEVLVNSIPKIERVAEELRNAGGTAAEIARIMDDNLFGALKRVRSAFEAVILEFGQGDRVGGQIRATFEKLAEVLRSFAANIEVVIDVAEALAFVLGVKVVKALVRMTAALLANPIGAFVAVVTLGTAALVGFADKIKVTEGGAATLQDVLIAGFNAVKDIVVPALEALGATLSAVFGRDFEFTIKGFIEGFAKAMDLVIGAGRGALLVLLDLFNNDIGNVFDGTILIAERFGLNLKRFFEDLANGIVGIFTSPLITIAKSMQVLVNSVAGVAAAANALGIISDKSRGRVEDAVAGIEASINDLQNRKIPKVFDSDATAREIDALDKQITNKFSKIGANIETSFREGFDQTNFQDFIAAIFDEAEQMAGERTAAAAAEAAEKARIAAEKASRGTPAAPGGAAGAPTDEELTAFDKRLQQLTQEGELLSNLVKTRGIAGEALKLEAELGERLDDGQRKLFENQLLLNQTRQDAIQLADELLGPQENLIRVQAALNLLLQEGTINQEQFNQKLREAKIAALELDDSISGGLNRGLLKIEDKLNDLASLSENLLVNAFNNAEDALVDFVRTGEFSFERFVDQLLDDIARLLIRLLILQAVQAATGTGGGLFSLSGAGSRQGGGPVQANRPFLVGEAGPELFVPQGQGNILPADQTAALAQGRGTETIVVQAPAPNITINNISDPNEVNASLASGDNDREVMNIMSRNRGKIKQILA